MMSSRAHILSCAFLLGASAAALSQEAPTAVEAATQAEQPLDPGEEASAQAAAMQQIESFGWKREGTVSLGTNAELKIPKGLRFTDSEGARKTLEFFGNYVSGSYSGLLGTEALEWFAVFEFNDVGYVKDDEKDKIDKNELLKAFKESDKAGNEMRKKKGLDTLNTVGWAVEPFYNDQAKSLEWGLILESGNGGRNVNYRTTVLGRKGVTEVTLVCGEAELPSALEALRKALTSFQYKSGESYAEYREGDKVAEYGLKGLMVGAGVLAAAKTGILGKLLKPLLIGFAVLMGVLAKGWNMIKGLFGGRKNPQA